MEQPLCNSETQVFPSILGYMRLSLSSGFTGSQGGSLR